MATYPDLSKVKKILVIKLRHHGDVLLSSPVFSVLKEKLPEASIDAYIYKETVPMLEGHPAITELLTYDRGALKKLFPLKRIWKEFLFLHGIRKKRYDLIINLTEGDRGALVCFFSKAKIRIGFDAEGKGMWQKNRCYTHVAKICHQLRHTVERNLDVLRCLGIFPTPQQRRLTLAIPEEAVSKVEMLFDLQGVDKKNAVIIHPVSRWLFKCWPADKFAELIRLLHSRQKQILLTSSPDPKEMAIASEILKQTSDLPIYNLTGKLTLKELAALISAAGLLVTVDSVPLHIASATKTPVVAIFGPTSEVNWAPWQHPQSRVVTESYSCRPCYMPGCGGSGKSDCLERLPVGKVFAAIEELNSSHLHVKV